MKRIIGPTLLFFFINTTFLFAQTALRWASLIGNQTNATQGEFIKTDNNGNVYVGGIFFANTQLTDSLSLVNIGSSDIFLIKYNSNGQIIWAKSFGGQSQENITGLSIDGTGNIYIAGNFKSSNLTIGTNNLSCSGGWDGLIIKLDANSNVIWSKKEGGLLDDYFTAMDCSTNGNFIISGYYNSNSLVIGTTTLTVSGSTEFNAFILKYLSDGSINWIKDIYGSGSQKIFDATLNSAGDIIAVGEFNTTVYFGNNISLLGGGITQYDKDMFLVKIGGSSGTASWAKEISGDANDSPNKVAVNSIGEIYLSGTFNSSTFNVQSVQITNTLGNQATLLAKFNSSGIVSWAQSFNTPFFIENLNFDTDNNLLLSGYYVGSIGIPNFPMPITNGYSSYFGKVNSNGNFIWLRSIPGLLSCTDLDAIGNYYLTGMYDTQYFIVDGDTLALPQTYQQSFTLKLGKPQILGRVVQDVNQNCAYDAEQGIEGLNILLAPLNILAQSNAQGFWFFDSIPNGNYQAILDTVALQSWSLTCPAIRSFTVSNPTNYTTVSMFGLYSDTPCSQPNISVFAPSLTRCFSNQSIYVNACNGLFASGEVTSPFVEIELDPNLTVNSASTSYSNLGNGVYRFDLGDLNAGQCNNFTLSTTVSCNATLGQTLCINAKLAPVENCILDQTPNYTNFDAGVGGVAPCLSPWDQSNLVVEGFCSNDTVFFTVFNTSDSTSGDMQCYSPIRVYLDGVLVIGDSIKLNGGQSQTFPFFGNGQTWSFQVDQNPLHPGNSNPSSFVELCGNASNWTPEVANELPQNDADPIIDIYCGVVVGSHDPNEKEGFPSGIGVENFIQANQQLQYVVRFQNTGTAVAYTVVVRDTLDANLNIFSVVPGVASHPYTFRMYGQRVLEWTFNNILLADSTTDEPNSHGFLTFTVEQNPSLNPLTKIYNQADIYFDFNEPVITNQTMHTIIDNHPILVSNSKIMVSDDVFEVYPNPTEEIATIEYHSETNKTCLLTISDMLGRAIVQKKLGIKKGKNIIPFQINAKGLFIINLFNSETSTFKKIIVK